MAKPIEDLKKKSRQTLENERKDLQDRQALLREKRDTLWEARNGLRKAYYAACEAKNDSSKAILEKELEDIKNDIAEIDKEYQTNSVSLESYSKVAKNRKEGTGILLGTLFTGLGTGAAIILGKKSLDRAFDADVNCNLVNKKVLDVFWKLNPLSLIKGCFRK